MYHYPFHVSDYIADTAHLSLEEDLAYRRLIDLYYTSEKPIPMDVSAVARKIRMANCESAIAQVLQEFFTLENDAYHHSRCDSIITAYQAKADRNRAIGKLGGRPKNPEETQTVSKNNPNQEPITNNHKPITKDKTATRGSRLPANWIPDKELAEWSKAERPDLDLRRVLAEFRDYWTSLAGSRGVKLDWDATWRNWVRKQTAVKQTYAQVAADVARMTTPAPANQDAALRQIIEDRQKAVPPPKEIREKMIGILGVKNA